MEMNESMLTEQAPMQESFEEQGQTDAPAESPAAAPTTEEVLNEQSDEAVDELSEVRSDEATDEATAEAPTESSEQGDGETAALQARIRELEEQLAEREQMSERIERECAEFEAYFPDVSLRRVPDEVWGQVHAGIPLPAAYALYEKKQQKQQADAERISRRGESMTAGITDAAGNQYFSPSQIRAMSPQEVRQNYDRIFESMRHWQ